MDLANYLGCKGPIVAIVIFGKLNKLVLYLVSRRNMQVTLSLSKNEPTVTKHNNPISQISQLTYKHGLTIAIWSYQQ